MKNEIKVPSLGESISDVTIGQILAPSGTVVKTDTEILELETDKVNQVLYASQPGQVQLTVKQGDIVKIGQLIGTIDSTTVSATDLPKKESSKKELPQTEPLTKVEPSLLSATWQNQSKTPPQEQNLRYTKEDFLTDLANPSLQQKEIPKETHVSQVLVNPSLQNKPSLERETRRPLSKIRKVIAQRLVEAQQTMAMLTTFNEIDLTQVIQLREKYQDTFIKKYSTKLGFMSFFVKATLSALHAFPDLNSYLDGEEIVHREYYDMGVAVGTDKGVIVPVIRDCDQLSYADIEKTLENYAKKAREGNLKSGDLQGGGFTITNGGVYGSLLSTPILMPPQCGILGMHKIEKRPVVINDQITIRSMMYIALSYDHRLIDGKEAVSFLVHIKNMLEDPSRLLLDI